MTYLLLAILLQASKIESAKEWKEASKLETTAVESDKGVDWEAAGEAWLVAARKLKQLPLQERGMLCFEKAWDKVDDANRAFLRSRLMKVSAPPIDYSKAPAVSGSPAGWTAMEMVWGASVDNRFWRTGKCSVKLLPAKEDVARGINGWSSAESLKVQVTGGKKYTVSVWVYSVDTDQVGDLLFSFRTSSGEKLSSPTRQIPQNLPLWKRVEIKAEAPKTAAAALVRVDLKFTRGALWVDDASIVDDETGKELLQNGGFEKR